MLPGIVLVGLKLRENGDFLTASTGDFSTAGWLDLTKTRPLRFSKRLLQISKEK